ncbi:TonB-dependent receptor [Ventosimonas gracilis]|uniref:TonB-dependent receptor n=1 Tax=Ventosimonas gracilis TaxID=1680762 RepID=A0A139SUA5_9GAMM|nr:TonB-dependent copper receptor [Ventosimonas gracilis]KXU38135.1 TonB-dependent receptor [Ventosimonas gracilis]
MKFPLHPLTIAVVSACLFPAAALADDQPSGAHRLDSILITTSAPSSALTWSTDPRLPRQPVPASDGADYLKTVAGFAAIRQGGSNGDPVLRGMFGSRLNILSNDGVLLGACPSRMDNPLSYIAPETFDRLTIIKGPQTVLWGPGASAGTVRFERDTPYFSESGINLDASALAASHDRNDQAFTLTTGYQPGYMRITGNRSESADYKDGNGHQVHSGWDKWNADLALGWTPTPGTALELSAGRGDAKTRYAGRGMDGSLFERSSYGLRFETSNLPGAWQSLSANLYHNDVDHVMDNYSLRTPNPSGSMPMPMASNVDRRTRGGRVALAWQADRLAMTFGLDGQDSRHRRRSGMGIDAYRAQPRVRDAQFRNLGIFAEMTVDEDRAQRWISGLRLDRAQARDDRATLGGMRGMPAMPNPSAGQTRKETLKSAFIRHEADLSPRLSGYLGLGHSERMPDYWELFSPNNGPAGAPNAFSGVQPEKTTQLDIGLNYKHEHLTAWLSAYAGVIDDYILTTYTNGMMGMSTRTTNVDARIAGSEAGVEWKPVDGWTLGTTLAWAWGENRSAHAALPQMPPLDARFSAAWQGGRWSAGALLRGVARQGRIAAGQGNIVGRDLDESSGFATLALNAGVRLSDSLQLTAGVDNLFNRYYSEHLNLAGSADFGYPADPVRIAEPGRTAWLKFTGRF